MKQLYRILIVHYAGVHCVWIYKMYTVWKWERTSEIQCIKQKETENTFNIQKIDYQAIYQLNFILFALMFDWSFLYSLRTISKCWQSRCLSKHVLHTCIDTWITSYMCTYIQIHIHIFIWTVVNIKDNLFYFSYQSFVPRHQPSSWEWGKHRLNILSMKDQSPVILLFFLNNNVKLTIHRKFTHTHTRSQCILNHFLK